MQKRKLLKTSLMSALFIIATIGMGSAAQRDGEVEHNQEQQELQRIFLEVKKAVQTKNFNILQKYVSQKGTLYWARCNTNVSWDLSFDSMVRELKNNAKDADIIVADHVLDFIETEGWTGEYPYLYFQFTKVDSKWVWLGVCHDTARSPDYRLEIGREKYYDRPPKLPRPGPRVFEDVLALKVRIIEILKFKAFDALKPYATKNKVLVVKSCPATLDSDELMKTGVPVEQAIEFLEKNSIDAKEITPDRRWSYKHRYFIINGWTGEKPEITFCFVESNKRWEWIGIAY